MCALPGEEKINGLNVCIARRGKMGRINLCIARRGKMGLICVLAGEGNVSNLCIGRRGKLSLICVLAGEGKWDECSHYAWAVFAACNPASLSSIRCCCSLSRPNAPQVT